MDRKQYVELNKILDILGWKRNRKEKCHIFNCENLQDAINEVCDIMEVIDIKVLYQQFYTPSDLAERLVKLADIKESDEVLEPSAWKGAIVDEIKKTKCKYIRMYEIDEINVKDLILHYYEEKDPDIIYWIEHCDFLEKEQVELVDKILANPPFSKSQDVKHILKMYEFLKPWWRIVSIASSSIETREWKIYDEFKKLNPEFIKIEDWAFKESWTMVNSVIVIINK